MSPNTHYKDRPTQRAVRHDPQFRIESLGCWTRISGVPLHDASGDGLYVIEVLDNWKLDFDRKRPASQWLNYDYEKRDSPDDFRPATAPQLAAIIDTLFQHHADNRYKGQIEHVRMSFPHDIQLATNTHIHYAPDKADSVMHTYNTHRGYRIEEHLAGKAARLDDHAPDIGKKCKVLFGTRASHRFNEAIHWLTGKRAVLLTRDEKQKYCARGLAFGNREELANADFYTLDADNDTDKELHAVGIRIVRKLS